MTGGTEGRYESAGEAIKAAEAIESNPSHLGDRASHISITGFYYGKERNE
jgi:hypothetical protein